MHIHFIGVGGISMSALAKICLDNGYTVSGSDSNESYILDELRLKGATIYLNHIKDHITDDIDLVVYTAAINEKNPEILAAKEKNIKLIDRAHFLGELMKNYKNSIAIAGTHGKTSTTSMTSILFENANLDPTILVGGNLKEIGGNLKIGSCENFITEACEYVNSFLSFNPTIGIVLNIEADHLDYFSSLEEIKSSFNKFGKLLPSNGHFIVNGDDENVMDILNDIKATITKIGTKPHNDAIIQNIKFDKSGCASFEIILKGENLGTFNLSVPGIHNVYNATCAIMCSLVCNIDIDVIKENITKYTGVGRRFEIKGYVNNSTIIDDYAHHPTEIKATLSAIKNMNKNKTFCVFQPHTYSRTKFLLDEFSSSFFDVDTVIITDIYAAREADTGLVHSKDLVNKLKEKNVNAIYIKDFDEIANYLFEHIKPNDIVVTAGAGNVYIVGEKLLKKVRN